MTFAYEQQAHTEPASIEPPRQGRLPIGTSEEFADRFGASLENVHVAPGAAASAAPDAGADAVIVGGAYAFGNGANQPGSGWGPELISHELTHVVQQRGGTDAPALADPAEVPSMGMHEPDGRRPRMEEARNEQAIPVPSVVDAVLRTPGQPLDAATLGYFEPRFGQDLSGVRVHDDSAAALSARTVNANAYTVGTHVVFDRGRYVPATQEGRRLLSHELAHVVHQQEGAPARGVLRQVKGPEWELPVPLASMSDQQLQDRYDAIVAYFLAAKQSTVGDDKLQNEAGQIGAILASRAGRTFAVADIARMRAFFEANAKAPTPKSCIATLNEGVKLVLGTPKQKTRGSVDETARELEASGRAGAVREVGFLDARGRRTTGTVSPVRLRESVWDAVIAQVGGDPGWSVFVMSLMDGYHSVTLSLDNTDPAKPRIFWSDQWSTKGGFKEYTMATLDAEIEHLTHAWWEEEAAGTGESALKTGRAIRMDTVVRLYRLRREPHHLGAPPVSRSVQPAP